MSENGLGFASATVSSLPWEVTERRRLSERLVQASMRTPSPRLSEAYRGRPAGLPAIAESYPGGAVSVTVSSLAWRPLPRAGPDETPHDQYARNAAVRQSFREFAGQAVRGLRITEYNEMGPKSGGASSWAALHSKHLPPRGVGKYGPGSTGSGLDDDEEEMSAADDRRRRTLKRKEPEVQDEETLQVRTHQGLSCQSAHGAASHGIWRAWCLASGY